jgi:hypothetical protein
MWRWEDVSQTPTTRRTLRADALGEKELTTQKKNIFLAWWIIEIKIGLLNRTLPLPNSGPSSPQGTPRRSPNQCMSSLGHPRQNLHHMKHLRLSCKKKTKNWPKKVSNEDPYRGFLRLYYIYGIILDLDLVHSLNLFFIARCCLELIWVCC